MNSIVTTVDVREDLKAGREPFSRIMGAVARLEPGEPILLIAPFEPVPLFRVMESRGFSHSARESEPGVWEVLFTPCGSPPAKLPVDHPGQLATNPAACAGTAGSVIDVDARGLEPPQPLVLILETVATLGSGAELRARTDRRPIHLYPQLEERGCNAETREQPDGSFLTIIRRN